MAKRLLVLLAVLFAGLTMYAQGQMKDVVYLKNGGMVRGIIVEQVPGVSIKIQTNDGNIFVYKIEEIEKMTKEMVQSRAYNMGYGQGYKSAGAAGVLSFFFPGAGQLYASNWRSGSGWICFGWTVAFAGAFTTIMIEDPYYLFVPVGLPLLGAHLGMMIYSIVDAVKIAHNVNMQNGYVCFPIGKKASLGFRPEVSYNNLLSPNGNLSSSVTTGVGISLNF